MKFTLYLLLVLSLEASSQVLTEDTKMELSLKDGDNIILYAAQNCSQCYYYLPSSLRISRNGRTPEASFVVWENDMSSKVIGGILHFLVEWGLRPGVDTEAQKLLRSGRDSLGVIMGAVIVTTVGYATIEGDDRLSRVLSASLKNTPSVPTTPGAKMALSFRFTEKEIEDFLYYVRYPDKATTHLSITYAYDVQSVEGQTRSNETTLRLPFSEILKTIKQTK